MTSLPRLALLAAFLSAGVAGASPASPWTVGSSWKFTLVDTAADAPVYVTFTVLDSKAKSCMGGDWRQLKRIDGDYKGLSEPAWRIEGDHLVVLLASDVCDRYDQLDGEISEDGYMAEHSLVGLGGSDPLGQATADLVK
jgi:hypothetical protein